MVVKSVSQPGPARAMTLGCKSPAAWAFRRLAQQLPKSSISNWLEALAHKGPRLVEAVVEQDLSPMVQMVARVK